jgi:hypothetical protein
MNEARPAVRTAERSRRPVDHGLVDCFAFNFLEISPWLRKAWPGETDDVDSRYRSGHPGHHAVVEASSPFMLFPSKLPP